MKDPDKFLQEASKGVVTVTFRKLNTNELRVMPCTMNRETSNNNIPQTYKQDPAGHNFAVWCLDKEAWRSFRVNTVEDWYPGYPKED